MLSGCLPNPHPPLCSFFLLLDGISMGAGYVDVQTPFPSERFPTVLKTVNSYYLYSKRLHYFNIILSCTLYLAVDFLVDPFLPFMDGSYMLSHVALKYLH